MNYEKMLFAFHVRQEAKQTMAQQIEGMSPEKISDFLKANMDTTIASIVAQVEMYADIIDDVYMCRKNVSSAAALSKAFDQ